MGPRRWLNGVDCQFLRFVSRETFAKHSSANLSSRPSIDSPALVSSSAPTIEASFFQDGKQASVFILLLSLAIPTKTVVFPWVNEEEDGGQNHPLPINQPNPLNRRHRSPDATNELLYKSRCLLHPFPFPFSLLPPFPTPLMLLPLLALLALASAAKGKQKQCYGIDGSPSADSNQPCNADAVFSPCCATNKAKPDICLSSGLCYAQDSGYEGFIYSNGCTDPTGRADACPHPSNLAFAAKGPIIGKAGLLSARTTCYSALDPDNCCGNAAAAVSVNVGQLVLPTPTPTPTTSTVCHPDRAVSSAERCSNDSSAAVVGGAVGGVLGAALLASLGALAVVCLRRKRETTGPQSQAYDSHHVHGYSHTAAMGAQHELPNRPVHEMQGSQYKVGGG
ncbi:hypothetical protein L249_8185 [Ophiocordyceps polyrhachis-furcata BCC 54312]|uniref:Uncharacterized protein n=1 Tax=Ophiocordyceps polyrhachis-furcata BCC 54312 TaxID=1330021 RepID=A0A367LH89_9HYPO|nr:hypothetical protein L249_8185 [Ophiocordyceps polyrhachis-furcata BCC 54312]